MHKLLVVYNEPKDPAHFRKYYVETHLPLASKMQGVKASRYSFDVRPLGPGKGSLLLYLRGRVRERGSTDERTGVEGRSGGCWRRAKLRFRRCHHGSFPSLATNCRWNDRAVGNGRFPVASHFADGVNLPADMVRIGVVSAFSGYFPDYVADAKGVRASAN